MGSENGEIGDFPQEVFAFFAKKGGGNTIVTPNLLLNLIGSKKICLAKYDIYVMGKKKGSLEPYYYTKLRIDTKASERNTVQGFLEVRFLAGYGYRQTGGDSSTRIMRPSGIQKLVTDDTGSFKKRAVIHLNDGGVIALSAADGFCDIPLMDDRKLAKFENSTNAKKKREAYARKKKTNNQWAHMSRVSMAAMNQKMILRMLLPYKNNLPEDMYFKEFSKDVVSLLLEVKDEFCPDAELELPDIAYAQATKRKATAASLKEPRGSGRRSKKSAPEHKTNGGASGQKNFKNANALTKISSSAVSW